MASAKLTKTAVDKAEPGFLWDTEVKGFGLRVTDSGARSYVFQFRMGGRESPARRHTIGKHGSPWAPDEARTEAKRLARLVASGVDPVEADKERRREAVDLAFNAYVERFSDGHLKSNWGPHRRHVLNLLQREPVRVLGTKPLPQITKADLARVWAELADRPAVLKYCFAILRKLFKWAVNQGDLERSPMESMECPATVPARDRVLKDEELAQVWQAAGTLGDPFGPWYRLLIITGQRRDEVAALPWSELDRQNAEWTLPASRAKNSVAHIVPLSPQAISILDAMAKGKKWPRRGLVFSTTGKTPISGYSRGKSRLDSAIAKAESERAKAANEEPRQMPAWRVHDLRRTLATGLQRLGTRLEVTEAVLNHVSGSRAGIVGVYQRHDWKDEKRAALVAWANHVDAIVSAVAPS